MSKYSKIKHANTRASKSLDLSDFSVPPQMHINSISNYNHNISHETKQIPNCATDEEKATSNYPIQKQGQENDGGEIFGVILSRKCPISSTSSSCKFMAEKQNPYNIPSMVKKTFSLKRSVSVSGGYCRIHLQCDPYDDENAVLSTMHARHSKKKGKIFKACRSLFGL